MSILDLMSGSPDLRRHVLQRDNRIDPADPWRPMPEPPAGLAVPLERGREFDPSPSGGHDPGDECRVEVWGYGEWLAEQILGEFNSGREPCTDAQHAAALRLRENFEAENIAHRDRE